jgi:hypothetical protein
MRLNPLRTAVAALRPRLDRTGRPHPLLPADRTRRADAEPLGCLAARHTLGSGIDDPVAKIGGKGFGHACWPPSPACSLNQTRRALGIPNDSINPESALGDQFSVPTIVVNHASNAIDDPSLQGMRDLIGDSFQVFETEAAMSLWKPVYAQVIRRPPPRQSEGFNYVRFDFPR